MSKLPPLVLRADASSRTGSGHIMRVLALAQVWRQNGGGVLLLSTDLPEALRHRLRGEGIELQKIPGRPGSPRDAREVARVSSRVGASWVVLDGYHFDDEFQAALKEESSVRTFVLDDFGHAEHRWADVVLNQNLYASRELYRANQGRSRLLLGPSYVLLRREFWRWREERSLTRPRVRQLLVSMGGMDTAGTTRRLLPALTSVCPDEVQVRVVLGGGSSLKVEDLSAHRRGAFPVVRVDRDVQDMAEVLGDADLAVAAAGITALELAFMGVPGLLVAVAKNQRPVAESLETVGAARNLGPVESLNLSRAAEEIRKLIDDSALRREMRKAGRRLIDGYGVERALAILNGSELWLRPARQEDSELLWRWANDPVTRQNSFSRDFIPWETHTRWFEEWILSGRALCYLAFTPEGQAVGQARFDDTPTGATISVNVAPSVRGQGYGTKIIRASVRMAIERRRYSRVTAYIKDENRASLRAFVRAGFHTPTQCIVQGCRTLALRFDKGDL